RARPGAAVGAGPNDGCAESAADAEAAGLCEARGDGALVAAAHPTTEQVASTIRTTSMKRGMPEMLIEGCVLAPPPIGPGRIHRTRRVLRDGARRRGQRCDTARP